jgi:hypothetical protein
MAIRLNKAPQPTANPLRELFVDELGRYGQSHLCIFSSIVSVFSVPPW